MGRVLGTDIVSRGELSRVLGDEVVVAAGAIRTPQLLLSSGVGPHDELGRAGIDTLVHLPGVGRGLTDHPYLAVRYLAQTEALDHRSSTLVPLAVNVDTTCQSPTHPDVEVTLQTRSFAPLRGQVPSSDHELALGLTLQTESGSG